MSHMNPYRIIAASNLVMSNSQAMQFPAGLTTEQRETSDCACAEGGSFEIITTPTSGANLALSQDCACAESGTILRSHATGGHAHAYARPHLHIDTITHDAILAFNPLSNHGAVVLNQAAYDLLLPFDHPQQLDDVACNDPQRHAALQRLAALDLLEPVGTQRQLQPGSEQTLVAWLHTTNACNLRCTYCYLDKTEEAMSDATGVAAVEAVFRTAQQHGFTRVKLKYAGGEATLNFRLVMQLHEHAAMLAQQTGICLSESVLSNGVALTRPMLEYLRIHDVTLMISLDGLGAGHDAQRVFANGRGSSRVVKRSIDRALEQGVSPHLSITVTGRNAHEVAAAVDFALDHDLLFNLNFYRDNDAVVSHDDLRAEDARMIAAMHGAFQAMTNKPPRYSVLSALVDRANFGAAHAHTCGAGHSYMVIDQRGGVARCQMEIEQSVTDIFAADPLTEIRLYDQGFQNVSADEKEGCRDCAWRYWCAGGCPALTYRATGRNDVKSPYCNVYKAIYPDLLRLEGLRLLKWHSYV